MIPFYSELKNLRKQQEIDLSEVASRTKINIKYLEAIESGDFSFLTMVYVRLFLRAYTLEIGSDPLDALKQLEIHLAKTEDISQPSLDITEESHQEIEEEELEFTRKTSFQTRSDLIKVVVLLVIVLFAIFIIRKIVSEAPAETETIRSPVEEPEPLSPTTDAPSSSVLISESHTQSLLLEPPYSFTIKASAPVLYELSIDTSASTSKTLLGGDKDSLFFETGFFLRIDQASYVELKINDSLVSFAPLPYPLYVTYQTDNNELIVTSYTLP